jgi:transposase-like protein
MAHGPDTAARRARTRSPLSRAGLGAQSSREDARRGGSTPGIAKDLGSSETGLRRGIDQARINVAQERLEVLTTDERRELAELRRQERVLLMECEMLTTAVCFAKKNQRGSLSSTRRRPPSRSSSSAASSAFRAADVTLGADKPYRSGFLKTEDSPVKSKPPLSAAAGPMDPCASPRNFAPLAGSSAPSGSQGSCRPG